MNLKQAKDLEIRKTDCRKTKPEQSSAYSFGKVFTDHMFQVDWDMATGWGKPRITPNEPIKIDTTATSLHYGISAFEGISIVKNRLTGSPQAFWAQNNLKSLVDSSDHLDLPKFDQNELLSCLKKLVLLD